MGIIFILISQICSELHEEKPLKVRRNTKWERKINKNNSGIASLRSQLHGFFVNRNEILCRDTIFCVSTVNKEYGNGD
jgi:hypothetical protein